MRTKPWITLLIGASIGVSACGTESSGPTQPNLERSSAETGPSQQPHVHGFSAFSTSPQTLLAGAAIAAAFVGDPTITYHGGPIIQAQKVAAIYWSSRTIYKGGPAPGSTGSGNSDGSLVGFFLNHIGGSPYYAINSLYFESGGHFVQNSVTYTQYWAPNTGVPAPQSNVTLSALEAKIEAGFTSGALTFDPNTVYLVFTDSVVDQDNMFNRGTCAEHGNFAWSGHDVKFAAMPRDLDQSACTQGGHVQGAGSPNNDRAADVEVNTIAHETEETTTDPDPFSAWYDAGQHETADKCAWYFDPMYTTANGSKANMNLAGKDFLIQKQWQLAYIQGCEVQVFSASVTGPFEAQPFVLCTWSSQARGGAPPYTYAWFGTTNITTPTINYVNGGTSFYAFVNIKDTNGVTVEPEEWVDVSQYDPRCGS